MKKRSYFISRLQCNQCGNITTIPRRSNRRRARHHVKTMYCPFCQVETDFTELDDYEDSYGGESNE